MVDTLTYILERRPKKVFAKKVHYLSKEREDFALLVLDYGDFVASIEVSCLHPEKARDLWIIGEKEKAISDLKKALELDISLRKPAREDEDFKNIWEEEVFKRIRFAF